MKLKNAVLVALVALLKVIVDTYIPQFPISAELINVVILTLLGLLGVDVVEFASRNTRFANNFK